MSRRHWALGLLFGAYALSLFDRQIVNILAPSIKNDFELSDGQLGMLTGTAFAILYSVSGIPLGRVADRVDRRVLRPPAQVTYPQDDEEWNPPPGASERIHEGSDLCVPKACPRDERSQLVGVSQSK